MKVTDVSRQPATEGYVFALVPEDVWKDKRLTRDQLRVLIVLYACRDAITQTRWPEMEALAGSLRESQAWVTARIQELEQLGWVGMEDGRKKVLCVEVTA